MERSECFELVRNKYEAGLWNARMLLALVSVGRITRAEYEEITGADPA
ncbi:MAG: XkdX family protein [Oscillospiraceae bacterium]|nr:XkdX family protein [Oscillospiraceae bacterium]